MQTKLTFIHAICLISLISCLTSSFAQIPSGSNYQAVIRDASGEILANDPLVKISFYFHSNTINGPIYYAEEHTTSTNEFGLVNVVMGQGIPLYTGYGYNYGTMGWEYVHYFLNVKVDTGSGYVDMGTQSMFPVPQALAAKTSLKAIEMYMEDLADVEYYTVGPPQEGQVLRFNADEGWFQPGGVAESLFFLQSGADLTLSDGVNSTTKNLGQWSRNGNFGTNSTNFLGTTDAQDLRFKTNDVERMRITDIGRVGIGTTNPAQHLHLNSSSTTAYQMFSNSTTGATAFSDGLLIGSGNNIGYVYNYENSDLLFGTDGSTRMAIKNDGKVGIGTSTPGNLLTIKSNDWPLRLENTAGNFWRFAVGNSSLGSNTTGKLLISNSGLISNTAMAIDDNGFVGIGVLDPSEFLDVAGTARLRNMDQSDLDPNCNFGSRIVHADCNGELVLGNDWEDGSSEDMGYYYMVPGSAFQPANPNVNYNINILGEMELLEGDFYNMVIAPVNLPHNAYILEVTAYVHDGFTDGNLTITLMQYDVVNGSSTADATTSGSGGDQVLTFDPDYSETVDNTSEAVSLQAWIEQSADPNFAGEVSITAVVIRYRLN